MLEYFLDIVGDPNNSGWYEDHLQGFSEFNLA
jgi:hypothetical protein